MISTHLALMTTPLVLSMFLDRPIMVVIYGITLLISLWLFRDARRRERSVGVAAGWAIGGILLPAVVHFIYLYGRLKTEGSLFEPPLKNED